jgi:hypothetical protein
MYDYLYIGLVFKFFPEEFYTEDTEFVKRKVSRKARKDAERGRGFTQRAQRGRGISRKVRKGKGRKRCFE